MSSENIFVLNGHGLTERSRVTASGAVKRRYTVSIKSEPIVHNLDPKALGKGPAIAIAQFYRDSISGIRAAAAPATVRAREVAQRAYNHTQRWSQRTGKTVGGTDRRYTGGKIGPMEPNQTNQLFNDSGRLIRSIAAALVGDQFVVNVAANRFDPDTLNGSGTAALQRIFNLLRQYVPQFGDAGLLMDALPVRRAVREATAGMFRKLDAAHSATGIEVLKQIIEIGQRVGDIAEAAA